MEHEIRGIIEKTIDRYLTSNQIQKIIGGVNNLEPIIKSKPDATFGWLMGILEAGFLAIVLSSKGRLATKVELKELNKILVRRSVEMMDFINRELMR